MLSSAPIMAFLPTKDPGRALPFYRDTTGLTFLADEPSALVFDANGTILRVTKVKQVVSASYTVLGWRVGDIGAAVRELAQRGVRLERWEGKEQDQSGVWMSPTGAKVAWFKDPDGNLLSITEFAQGSLD
jgi:catechol 2,3-dioxygenase-like lactoylglutathione lyase family enzyme